MKSELDYPIWSIVAADPRHPIRSTSTTYAEAQNRRKVLESMGADGLAIVTNAVAERIETALKANAQNAETV